MKKKSPFTFLATIFFLVDGKLILSGNSGRSLDRLDPFSGKTLMSARAQGRHAFTYADGRLYTFYLDGKVALTDVNSFPGSTLT